MDNAESFKLYFFLVHGDPRQIQEFMDGLDVNAINNLLSIITKYEVLKSRLFYALLEKLDMEHLNKTFKCFQDSCFTQEDELVVLLKELDKSLFEQFIIKLTKKNITYLVGLFERQKFDTLLNALSFERRLRLLDQLELSFLDSISIPELQASLAV